MKSRRRFPVWMWGPVFMALAALACDAPPLTGITCLERQDDGTIVAPEQNNSYVSTDGGLTWQQNGPLAQGSTVGGCQEHRTTRFPWRLTDPANPTVIYNFNPEISIERSDDGGATWRREIDLSGTEARTTYYVTTRHDGVEYRSGPLDSVFDTMTGNLVVAMGYEGVLVRTPEARWGWVAVGKYNRVDMRDMSITLPLISSELWLAALLGVVVAGSLPTLARGTTFWHVLGAVTGSIAAAGGMLFLLMQLLPGVNRLGAASDAVSWLALIAVGAIVLVLPAALSWTIATRTHQENRLAFTWSAIGWAYLITLSAAYFYNLSLRI